MPVYLQVYASSSSPGIPSVAYDLTGASAPKTIVIIMFNAVHTQKGFI